ncbi:hypothetical protein HPG69_006295, partial [Diceros bicornis minor]
MLLLVRLGHTADLHSSDWGGADTFSALPPPTEDSSGHLTDVRKSLSALQVGPTTAVANPILSFLDVKRILFQKITDKGDELKKAFQLLDTAQNMTVSKSELRRIVTTFLLPLTREQFQDVLAQVQLPYKRQGVYEYTDSSNDTQRIPLTSSGAVPYHEFLSRFGGIDLNINVITSFHWKHRGPRIAYNNGSIIIINHSETSKELFHLKSSTRHSAQCYSLKNNLSLPWTKPSKQILAEKIHCRVLKKNLLKNLRIVLQLNSFTKTLYCIIPLPGQAPQIQVIKANSSNRASVNRADVTLLLGRGGGNEMNCCRTLKELEIQVGEKTEARFSLERENFFSAVMPIKGSM